MGYRYLACLLACATTLACSNLRSAPSAPIATAAPPALPTAAAPAATSVGNTIPAARVQATLADYQRWLDELQAHHGAAGLATAVVIDGKVVFEGTVGATDTATGTPITPDTVFRLASLSKAFASAITGLEVSAGKLRWDTRVVDVLPWFALKDPQYTGEATVADVLGQRLGLPPNAYDNLLEAGVPYTELTHKLAEVDDTCAPGACYGYQNIAFSLIGNVLDARTGVPFEQLVSQRLFQPLGMRDASYGLAGLMASRSWARPHRAGAHDTWVPFTPNDTYYQLAPAAGVNASLRDMEQWLIAQMGGRPAVLPPALLDVLHAPDVATPGELTATAWRRARLTHAYYALGWRVYSYGGHTLIYHAGAVAGYRTMIGFFPEYRIGVVTLWNSSGAMPSGLMPMVFDSLLGLPHVDWADVEGPVKAATPKRKARPRKRHR